MSLTAINNRPSSTRNWADDDDDDFDFDSWKATADTSAPTMADLPPLQRAPTELDLSFTVDYGKTANETAPWVEPKEQPVEVKPVKHDPSTYDWSWGKPTLANRFVNGRVVDKPAYRGMSGYDGGKPYDHKRVNYSIHWSQFKANAGVDCKLPVQWLHSPLRAINMAYPDIFDDLDLGGFFEFWLENVGIEVTSKSEPFQDEGYISEDSPPISPTLASFDETADPPPPTSASAVILTASNIKAATFRPKHRRAVDSMDLIDTNIIDDLASIPLPEVKYIDQTHTVTTYITNTLATGWFLMSFISWTTTGIIVADTLAAATVHLTRRR